MINKPNNKKFLLLNGVITICTFIVFFFSILSIVSAEDLTVHYGTSLTLSKASQQGQVVNEVIKYSLLTTTSVVAVAQASSITLAGQSLSINEFLKVFVSLLFIKRKKQQQFWGLIYNKVNSKPIAFAVIRVFVAGSNKAIITTVSDIEGKYGIVLDPGKYKLSVEHQDYIFNGTGGLSSDNDVYQGGTFEISDLQGIHFNIPMESKAEEHGLTWRNFKNWFKKTGITKLTDNVYFIIFFCLLNLGLCLLSYSIIYVMLTIYYAFILLLRLLTYFSQPPRTWGRVVDETGSPVSNAFIKVYIADSDKLVDTKISDNNGRFQLFLEKGRYQILVNAQDYELVNVGDDGVNKNQPMIVEVKIGGINIDLVMKQVGREVLDKKDGTTLQPKFGVL